jgi:3'(2'), 5'-bisphosphate nucleotidase
LNLSELLPIAIHAAEEASKEILEVYNSGAFQAEVKKDNSPLTLADKRAHAKIVAVLAQTSLPVLSEEGSEIPYEARKEWDYFWLVDPLDGTKEFVKRNGEFTVNIALIHKCKPILGVVAIPVSGELYYGAQSLGAHRRLNNQDVRLETRKPVDLKKPGLRVVASRSHMSEETRSFIDGLISPTLLSSGSSIKFMLVASGKADVYPRFAPTMEWDTAASHAICNSVGIKVCQVNSKEELMYNKENLLNPYFLCL